MPKYSMDLPKLATITLDPFLLLTRVPSLINPFLLLQLSNLLGIASPP